MKIRCSSLPRIMKCGGSAGLEQAEREPNPAATLGTAEHEREEREWPNGTSPYGRYIARAGIVESQGSWGAMRGTADFVALNDEGLVYEIVDLKTGKIPVAPNSPQLWGYALLHLPRLASNVRLTIHQNGVAHSIDTTKYMVEQFGDALRKVLERADLVRGDWCQWCDSEIYCKKAWENLEMDGLEKMEMLERATDLARMIKKLKADIMITQPELVRTRVRKTKVWLDDRKGMTVAQAIKAGLDVEGQYKIVETEVKYL